MLETNPTTIDTTTSGSVLLRKIRLQNVLSFGPKPFELELRPLNVLIGPNGSGKSNLIDAIDLMRATPNDFQAVIRKGGGVGDWIWKSKPTSQAVTLELVVNLTATTGPVRHQLVLGFAKQQAVVFEERIEPADSALNGLAREFMYRLGNGPAVIWPNLGEPRSLDLSEIDLNRSALALFRDARAYPEMNQLWRAYESIRLYREWCFGRNARFREPQQTDLDDSRLEEDLSNFALFLNRLQESPTAKQQILAGLSDIDDGITDFGIRVRAGTAQLFLMEGETLIPTTRLSDGTLRYLSLLAILCDPEPPKVICIEEPELGLHPDILPKMADLLVSASERTQIIVTTHSDILIDALSDHAESVIVCEKRDGVTAMERLKKADLEVWLDRYRLGDLWLSGQIGGVRW